MRVAPLSPLAQLLWYKLIQLENRERWPDFVTVPNQELTTLVNVAQRNTIAKARTELIDAGYLFYTPGRKGAPGQYTVRLLNQRYRFADAPGDELDQYFGMTPEVKAEIEKITLELFATYRPGYAPTSHDRKCVYEAICEQKNDGADNWTIEIDYRSKGDLAYAFEAAANANAVNWNYIGGVLRNIAQEREPHEYP